MGSEGVMESCNKFLAEWIKQLLLSSSRIKVRIQTRFKSLSRVDQTRFSVQIYLPLQSERQSTILGPNTDQQLIRVLLCRAMSSRPPAVVRTYQHQAPRTRLMAQRLRNYGSMALSYIAIATRR